MRIGVHVPVSGGLVRAARRARYLKLDCLQIFARNARGWQGRRYSPDEIARFRAILDRNRVGPLVVHSCYLVNLASPDPGLRGRSLAAVADDMERGALLGATSVVFHTGHHMGEGIAAGLRTLARSLRALLASGPPSIELLLENSVGRGSELGRDWHEFAQLLDLLHGEQRVGVCFDTCHAHAAGYRLDSGQGVARAMGSFKAALGLARLRLIHLNDSRAPAASHQDLHEHIGRGTIGDKGFRAWLRRRELRGSCAILETPLARPSDDLRNVRHVRALLRGPSPPFN